MIRMVINIYRQYTIEPLHCKHYNASANVSNLFSDIIGDLAFSVKAQLVNDEEAKIAQSIKDVLTHATNLLLNPIEYCKYWPFTTDFEPRLNITSYNILCQVTLYTKNGIY